jgi:hypothetical protein
MTRHAICVAYACVYTCIHTYILLCAIWLLYVVVSLNMYSYIHMKRHDTLRDRRVSADIVCMCLCAQICAGTACNVLIYQQTDRRTQTSSSSIITQHTQTHTHANIHKDTHTHIDIHTNTSYFLSVRFDPFISFLTSSFCEV